MDFTKLKTIYFMGIKGVGMTPLAIIAKQAGYQVIGSDVKDVFITDLSLKKARIEIIEEFSSDNIDSALKDKAPESVLVIVTAAHGGMQNVEAKRAMELGIEVLTQGKALGMFMEGKIIKKEGLSGVSVCGSHGKTTITALLATVLSDFDLDPSYVVGTGELFPLGLPGHLGKGKYFITESDEYVSDVVSDRVPKFFYQNPRYIIANNLDFDHPDVFSGFDEVKQVFKQFFESSSVSTLFINGDDLDLVEIVPDSKKIITYGKNKGNDYTLTGFSENKNHSALTVRHNGLEYDFRLSILGQYNAVNALSVIAFCHEIGIGMEKIQNVLPKFLGSKRRFELIGTSQSGFLIYDDYAHHPHEIKTTLKALSTRYPEKKITCVFQPHTYSRTQSLMSEFPKSFSDCERLLLLPIFASAREDKPKIDVSEMLFEAIKARFSPVINMYNHESVVEYIARLGLNTDDIVVTMGAGDVYKISEKLKDKR